MEESPSQQQQKQQQKQVPDPDTDPDTESKTTTMDTPDVTEETVPASINDAATTDAATTDAATTDADATADADAATTDAIPTNHDEPVALPKAGDEDEDKDKPPVKDGNGIAEPNKANEEEPSSATDATTDDVPDDTAETPAEETPPPAARQQQQQQQQEDATSTQKNTGEKRTSKESTTSAAAAAATKPSEEAPSKDPTKSGNDESEEATTHATIEEGAAKGGDDDDDNATVAVAITKRKAAPVNNTLPPRPLKRARPAYFIFTDDRRPKVQSEHPGEGVAVVARVMGQMWANLDPEEKEGYQQQAAQERARIAKELEDWKAAGGVLEAEAGHKDSSSALVFPLARIRKICRLDPEVRGMSKEALWLVTKCAELATSKLGQETVRVAQLQNRRKLLPEDVAHVCANREQFLFLKDDVKDLVKEMLTQQDVKAVGAAKKGDAGREAAAAGSKPLTSYFGASK